VVKSTTFAIAVHTIGKILGLHTYSNLQEV
jgi:hypothetical protein